MLVFHRINFRLSVNCRSTTRLLQVQAYLVSAHKPPIALQPPPTMTSPGDTRVNTPTSRKSLEYDTDSDDEDKKDEAVAGDKPAEMSDSSGELHDEHEHGQHELAPLPDIGGGGGGRKKTARTSSFTSGHSGPGRLRSRPRAFSAGAGTGAVVTLGGELPTTAPIYPPNGANHGLAGHFKDGTAGGPLALTASRVSNVSNHTFADAASLVNLPGLSRVETRTERRARARAGTVTTLASLARTVSAFTEGIDEKDEKDERDSVGEEALVAVQILDDGDEVVYPDGGIEVSTNCCGAPRAR